ncbi:Asp-tRNA(Asn)/Glu-tRNA(Gln) amidotransferase subunit GatC [uncultured Zhongshania sp.]|mgnify:FL=1|jgi:aspartyl-tRNA(Asn)/glutamyl-tRNA(Gln) amidotransferase subunit C|uniref:Asp-tRNA(Asn)/Glu-tRNA(Gln) amidotransferase subunit GatC n=1 Tax=Zhongshania sp. TaxID=1971902 RepID=UPI0030D99D6D|tara:strand:- start:721 stop:1119 length:399 start_codon:yes stop_codon:yes gene_type:complete
MISLTVYRQAHCISDAILILRSGNLSVLPSINMKRVSMSLDQNDIAKLARLARINVAESDTAELSQRIGDILNMVDAMQAVDTTNVVPMANPHDATQRLRADEVNEINQREHFQKIAPQTADGLYLVPQVIE